MGRYFFDVRDGDDVARDELGLELPDLHAAIAEAKHSLADIAREAMKSPADTGELATMVRDGSKSLGSIRMSYELQLVPLPVN